MTIVLAILFLGRVFNKIKVFNKKGLFPSYMGQIESKNDIMRYI